MNLFTEQAIKVILSVPSGKVLSYGRVALLAGSPYAARQVGWILSGMTQSYELPWHRIVNAKGKISMRDPISYQEQKIRLEAEGIVFLDDDTLNLKNYMWDIDAIQFDLISLEAQ